MAPNADPLAQRKLRAHKKSRRGCKNCKLRKIKCDETQPQCGKCQTFGYVCSYSSKGPDLQLELGGTNSIQMKVRSLTGPQLSENQMILGTLANTRIASSLLGKQENFSLMQQLTMKDLKTLHRFQTRTVLSLSTKAVGGLYGDAYSALTLSHPFLLHIVLTVALKHDQYLGIENGLEQDQAISHHFAEGVRLLNQKLSLPVAESERDALWSCAILLGALAFASVQGRCPNKVWPFKQSESTDLDWLKMTEGKQAIWEIADPLREQSIFRSLGTYMRQWPGHITTSSFSELRILPAELLRICHINETSTQDNNPYLASASCLTQVIDINCTSEKFILFVSFLRTMQGRFRDLLSIKDPAALLLLAFWYARVSHLGLWWLTRRAVLECQSICMYLEQEYAADEAVQELLAYPKSLCGQLTVGAS